MPMRKIRSETFAKTLRDETQERKAKFAFFLGAGCSVSSGIPTASTLVRHYWVPRLKDRHPKDFADHLSDYDESNPEISFGTAFKALYSTPSLRRQEAQARCNGRLPGLGYAILAGLLADKDRAFNVALTTNFDELVSDALNLYANVRARVISDTALASDVSDDDESPLVVKVHGDFPVASLAPDDIVTALREELIPNLLNILSRRGLIFLGYAGNDASIVRMLERLDRVSGPKYQVYWINGHEPAKPMLRWLEAHDALWVENQDFDDLMWELHQQLGVPLPAPERLGRYGEHYRQVLASFARKRAEGRLHVAGHGADDDPFAEWWRYEVAARYLGAAAPDLAERIFATALVEYKDSVTLHCKYANFLKNVRGDMERAAEAYERAMKINSEHPYLLVSYARFLKDRGRDSDGARNYFERAAEHDRQSADALWGYADYLYKSGNYMLAKVKYKKALELAENGSAIGEEFATICGGYADFLADEQHERRAPDEALHLYVQALVAAPDNYTNLANFALFLARRGEDEWAENHFERALRVKPNGIENLVNYAGFLLTGRDRHRGVELLPLVAEILRKRSESLTGTETAAEGWFYAYAHRPERYADALRRLKREISAGARTPRTDLTAHVKAAAEAPHPQSGLVHDLEQVLSGNADAARLESWDQWKNADGRSCS